MFKVNDYVVYNSTGVYKIMDITQEMHNDEYKDYYVLQPVYAENLTIKTPINNPKLSMRKIMTKEEVMALIDSIPETELIWINDDRERSKTFKAVLKTADSEQLVKLVRSIHFMKQERKEQGKKLSKVDEIAELLRINLGAAYELCRQEDFPSFQVNHSIRVHKKGLLRWVEEQYLTTG